MNKKLGVFIALFAIATVLGACSKSVNVEDLDLEEDLTSVVEVETGQTVADLSCPETVDDAKDGSEFSCDAELDDGSTVTVNLKLEETSDNTFRATYEGIEE